MSNIPTAEEFTKILLTEVTKCRGIRVTSSLVEEHFIKFAKLHVEAALRAASERVEIHSDSGSSYHREFEEGIRNRVIWVPSNSILNAYPPENIK